MGLNEETNPSRQNLRTRRSAHGGVRHRARSGESTGACGPESERILRLQGVQARRVAVAMAKHLVGAGSRPAVDTLAIAYAPFDRVNVLSQVVRHFCEGGDDRFFAREAPYPHIGSLVPAAPMRVLTNGEDGEPGVLRMVDLRAPWLIVHHWQPECLPCRESDDSIAGLRASAAMDVQTVSIVVANDPAGYVALVGGPSPGHLVLLADSFFRRATNLTSLPSVALVDSTGVVVERCIGCTAHPALFGTVRRMIERWF